MTSKQTDHVPFVTAAVHGDKEREHPLSAPLQTPFARQGKETGKAAKEDIKRIKREKKCQGVGKAQRQRGRER